MSNERPGEFGREFFDKYPRCFPIRRVLLPRWKWRFRRVFRFMVRWRLGLLRGAFLWFLGAANQAFPIVCFTRNPACGAGCGRGWWLLLHDLFGRIEQLDLPDGFCIDQVKEKFGELRIYSSVHDDEAEILIDRTTTGSRSVCEYCGAPGELRGRYWVKTLCEDCEKERQA